MKLTVRRVQPRDIGNLHNMVRDFNQEKPCSHPTMDDEEVTNQMLYILGNLQHKELIFLIAYDGKRPAGFLFAFVQDYPYGRPRRVGVVQELYVVPEKRSKQVAMALMSRALHEGLQLHAERFEACGIYGDTDKRWARLGFKPYLTYSWADLATAERILSLSKRVNR